MLKCPFLLNLIKRNSTLGMDWKTTNLTQNRDVVFKNAKHRHVCLKASY